MPVALAVHGGAWNIPDADVPAAQEGVRRALALGWSALCAGARALDVVELVVRDLEDDPAFDAGHGSRLNQDGGVEMDASIMDGRGLAAGAVAAIGEVRHPISVARLVLERSPHVLLVGRGAHAFARQAGAELCATAELVVEHERERYRRVRAGERELVDHEFREDGTVGCVALDRFGNVAAGTSTGGTQDKVPGRVGDTPIIGAGTYADDRAGAASATGWGESILRVVLCKTAVDLLAAGHAPDVAGALALCSLERVQGRAGLILVDPRGRVAAVFNTPRMARGLADEQRGPRVAVDPGDGAA